MALAFFAVSSGGANASTYDNYSDACWHRLVKLQHNLEQEFHLSRYPHYHWSQPDEQLIFSDNGKPKVIANIQFVGDISNISKTWLWAWANKSVLPEMKTASKRVRDYGLLHGYSQLEQPEWSATEDDGWTMTAIAADVLHAKGAYRSPGKNGLEFMVITDIHWAK